MPDAANDQLAIMFGINPKAKGDQRVDIETVLGLVNKATSLVASLTSLGGADVVRDVAAYVARVLEMHLSDIAIGFWNQRKEIRKFRDTNTYRPEQEYRVKLKKHTLKWTYRPYIEVTVGNVQAMKIDLVLTIEVELGGPVLLIKGGCYRAIEFGDAKISGELKLEDAILLTKSSAPYPLPGAIALGDGIPIGDAMPMPHLTQTSVAS